eukprot:scaffold12479_cov126-Isochrysis_galbana.AAC.3
MAANTSAAAQGCSDTTTRSRTTRTAPTACIMHAFDILSRHAGLRLHWPCRFVGHAARCGAAVRAAQAGG